MKFSDNTTQRLVSLLRDEFSGMNTNTDGVHPCLDQAGSKSDAEHFRILSAEEWEALYVLAAQQGVLAITYGILKRKGLESLPPREIRLRWALGAEQIEARYARHHEAAGELAALFAKHNIRMMVFKGLALSRYYPTPCYREFGDIDIYLFGDYEKANKIIESLGIGINYENEKHAVFTFNGVMVENHATLTDRENRHARIIEDAAVEYLNGAEYMPEGYYVPPAEFDLLFVTRHSARHFPITGIAFRHIIDWGLLLKAKAESADMERVRKIVAESEHAKFWDLSTRAATYLTGMDLAKWHISAVTDREVSQFFDFMIEDGIFNVVKSSGVLSPRTKAKRIFGSRNKYKFLPEDYWHSKFWPTMVKILNRPGMLFR